MTDQQSSRPAVTNTTTTHTTGREATRELYEAGFSKGGGSVGMLLVIGRLR